MDTMARPAELPSTATPPGGAVLVVVTGAGVLAAAGHFTLAFADSTIEQPGLLAALASWITLPYIMAGLVAWRRRPESRLGPLMVTAGFLSFASFLGWSSNDIVFTLGMVCDFLPPVVFLHVFLAFPTGRLRSRTERLVVASAYIAAGLSLVRLGLGAEAPRNVLAVADQPAAAEWLLVFQLLTLSATSLAGIAVLLARRRRVGRPLRPMMGYLVDSFALGLLMIALLLVAGLLDWSIAQPIRLATFAVMGVAPIVFLAGLLHARLARGSLATLIVELGVNPPPDQLRDAVARALRDPSVAVAYWLPEFDSYADADGHEIALDVRPGRGRTPIERDARPVAVLMHDAALEDEPELLSSVATAVGMAIENARLQVELRARVEELRGSRIRILEAGQQERRRLERDLHDGAQQRLVALSLELAKLEERVGDDPELRTLVTTAADEVATSLVDLRDLARGIHPAIVTDHGLMVAVESLATRATLPVQVVGSVAVRLPEAVEMAAFFFVSETLTNIAKHAQATSATVTLAHEGGALHVEVSDDGIGGATTSRGTGLRGLADRVEALGGRVRVVSRAGQGTSVTAEIPCVP